MSSQILWKWILEIVHFSKHGNLFYHNQYFEILWFSQYLSFNAPIIILAQKGAWALHLVHSILIIVANFQFIVEKSNSGIFCCKHKKTFKFHSTDCQCNLEGTIHGSFCNRDDGQCACKANWTGQKCETTGIFIQLNE